MGDIPEPKEWHVSQYYDHFDRTFTQQVHQALDMPRNFRKVAGDPKQAENVDSFGEVASSSWFANRNGRRRMSLEEIRRGPNEGEGPADGIWTVVRGKSEGVSLGFTIKDSHGDRYIMKFDPCDNPEMSSAAEVISTKLFYAMGYNTPENRIVYFKADRLRVDPEATIVSFVGRRRTMTRKDLDRILSRAHRAPDGIYRAMASKLLSGIPKGPFSYLGTRKDDPNDIFPHEHRRELRGLRILAAWLEHNDSRRINTLDMYVTEGGRRFLKHYLLDFGATLGSASLFPNQPWEGHEYILDTGKTVKSLFTLGVYKRSWLDAKPPLYPSVGYFESELFNPANWKPNYPNPAFENTTSLDAYWGTKIVMSFTDEQIRAAVETGELSDPKAEAYVIQTLIERRDKIGRYWYGMVNALDHASIEDVGGVKTLVFEDLTVEARFSDPAATSYRYRLSHNGCEEPTEITQDRVVDGTAESAHVGIPLDPELTGAARDQLEASAYGEECDRFFYLTLWTKREPSAKDWGNWVRVHLYFVGSEQEFRLVGVEHEG